MKIRNGFVSNSSSTSFCICGIQTDGAADDYPELFKKAGLDVHSAHQYGWEDGAFVIGFDINKLKDDEKLSDFKERIRKELIKVDSKLINENIKIVTNGWYNG